ncbi:MAG: TonB-dependent siderophore receptor [Pseudomonas sp.]|nr:TonB-dependent siderophore receptor [Pseudomonas sp.]
MATCSWGAMAEVELDEVQVQGESLRDPRARSSASVKYVKPLLDVPQTVTVVGEPQFREQNALSLRSVLSNVSGITFNAGEGSGGSGDSINIRGFSANANLQLDGLRDSAQVSRSDTFNLQAVEVIKGPNSVFGGAGTTGGTINMISKAPQGEAFTELGAGLGTDHYRRLTLDTNQPLAGVGVNSAFRLNLMSHENTVPGRDHLDRQRWGLAPSLALGLSEQTRLTLSYLHQRDDARPDFGLPARDGKIIDGVSRQAYFGWRNLDKDRATTDSFTVQLQHDFNDNLSLQNLSRYSQVKREAMVSASHVNLQGMAPGRYRPAGPQAYGRNITSDLWINQTTLNSTFDTFGLGHALVLGMEVSREHYRRDAYRFNLDKFVPKEGFELAKPPGYWSGPKEREALGYTRNSLDDKALFVFDSIALNPQWDLSLGLRYDWIKGRGADYKPATGKLIASAQEGALSSRAGLVYKPVDNGRFYLAYGTSFNPTAEHLASNGSGLSAGTQDLGSETSKTWELGTKWALLDDRLELDAALFRVQKDNVRERLLDDTYLAAGRQRVQGLELSATGRLTEQWNLFANYTYQQSRTLESATTPKRVGQALGNTPPRSFNVWTTYQLPGDFTLGYGMRHVSERNVTSQDSAKLAAYWVHDAMLGYKVSKHLDLQLNLDNLFDKGYVERVRQATGSQSRSSAVELGDGRSAVLSGIYRF